MRSPSDFVNGHQAVLLIALTGWCQDEDRKRSSEACFDHHLVKPVDLDALVHILYGLQVAAV